MANTQDFLLKYNRFDEDEYAEIETYIKNKGDEIKEFLTENKNFDVCENEIFLDSIVFNQELAIWIVENHSFDVNKKYHEICMFCYDCEDKSENWTALDQAIFSNRWKVVKALLKHPKMDVNNYGSNSMHPFVEFKRKTT